mmetsp:Transcript_35709/g.81460  ORF Transcript_35709/g.81460 Transcript_35709/m.81460 type:complete len:286 (-) Transcript_35709:1004-1861(-)
MLLSLAFWRAIFISSSFCLIALRLSTASLPAWARNREMDSTLAISDCSLRCFVAMICALRSSSSSRSCWFRRARRSLSSARDISSITRVPAVSVGSNVGVLSTRTDSSALIWRTRSMRSTSSRARSAAASAARSFFSSRRAAACSCFFFSSASSTAATLLASSCTSITCSLLASSIRACSSASMLRSTALSCRACATCNFLSRCIAACASRAAMSDAAISARRRSSSLRRASSSMASCSFCHRLNSVGSRSSDSYCFMSLTSSSSFFLTRASSRRMAAVLSLTGA